MTLTLIHVVDPKQHSKGFSYRCYYGLLKVINKKKFKKYISASVKG